MRRPPLLLLDEPADGLDLPGREALLAALALLAGEQPAPAVVLVTHHLEELPPTITHALLLAERARERLRRRARRPRRRAAQRLLRRAGDRVARGRPLGRARHAELVAVPTGARSREHRAPSRSPSHSRADSPMHIRALGELSDLRRPKHSIGPADVTA